MGGNKEFNRDEKEAQRSNPKKVSPYSCQTCLKRGAKIQETSRPVAEVWEQEKLKRATYFKGAETPERCSGGGGAGNRSSSGAALGSAVQQVSKRLRAGVVTDRQRREVGRGCHARESTFGKSRTTGVGPDSVGKTGNTEAGGAKENPLGCGTGKSRL